MIGSSRELITGNRHSVENRCGRSPNRNPETGLMHALSSVDRGVKPMQKLIELYEMASLNDAALDEREKLAIMEARRGLRKFVRAMDNLRMASVFEPVIDLDAALLAAWKATPELPCR